MQLVDPPHSLASERSSIERTYELTKYLEHQLKDIKDTYLSYLGPPFNDKDFSPPRPNSTALSLPSAATRLELWRGLENRARLAQNQRAYAVLLAAVRELAHTTLCPYLQTSLLHFSTGLDGLLGSISGLMNTLGYTLPPVPPPPPQEAGASGGRGSRPASLMTQRLYDSGGETRAELGRPQRRGETRAGAGEGGARRESGEKKRGKEGRRGGAPRERGGREERGGRRGRRGEPESWEWAVGEEERVGDEEEEEEPETEGGVERWGRRRRLLSTSEEVEEGTETPGLMVLESDLAASRLDGDRWSVSLRQPAVQVNNNNNNHHHHHHDNSDNSYSHVPDSVEYAAGERHTSRGDASALSSSSSSVSLSVPLQRRAARSLLPPTSAPLAGLSLLYSYGGSEEDHALLPQPAPLSLRRGPPLLSSPPLSPLLSSLTSSPFSPSSALLVRPALNDFSRKVEGFWVLRELQSWLWRSAKDFNRLKKRLRI